MTDPAVTYDLSDGIVEITIDDGKASALSPAVIEHVDLALDRAEADEAAVLIVGRPGMFTAGFDRGVIKRGPDAAVAMFGAGGRQWLRLLTYPRPVVMACTGHAVAAGAVMLCVADWRVAAAGDFKIGLNEVGLGLTLQGVPLEIVRDRIARPHFTQATLHSRLYDPAGAAEVGWVDAVVPVGDVVDRARLKTQQFAAMPPEAYAQTKRQSRRMLAKTLEKMMSGRAQDVTAALRS